MAFRVDYVYPEAGSIDMPVLPDLERFNSEPPKAKGGTPYKGLHTSLGLDLRFTAGFGLGGVFLGGFFGSLDVGVIHA